MKKLTLLITIVTVIFTSCSKEKSVDNTDPNGGGSNNKTSVLVKTAIKVGQDSAVNNYGYDSQKRLVTQSFTGNNNLLSDYGQTTITRNSQGVIERIMIVEDGSSGQTEYKVYYDATAKRYKSKTSSEVYQGMTLKDSTVYTYNASNQITQELYFISDGSAYYEFAKTEYTYTSGNLTSAKYFYRNASNQYVQSSAITYEYDAKTPAMNLGAEAIVLEQSSGVSANNVTKLTYTDLEDASNNEVVTFTYTYNSSGRPASASILIQSVGIPLPMTYFYS